MSGAYYVRRTENWEHLQPEAHLASCVAKGPALGENIPLLTRNLRLWNERFRINYPQYRHELTKLATKSWQKTGLKRCETMESESATYICPTDDDDLFRADLSLHLDRAFSDPDVQLVHWNCHSYYLTGASVETQRGIFTPSGPVAGEQFLASNGYAVRCPAPQNVVMNHLRATDYLRQVKSVFLEDVLSVWVRHPGSLHYLQNRELDEEQVRTLHPPPAVSESRGFFEEMTQLFQLTQALSTLP